MIVPVMAISNLVLTQQIYSEETNGAHAHYREPVPLRTILGYSKSVSYDFLLKMADIKSLKKRRQFQSLVMLYRCLYDKGAPYISEFL